MIKIHCNQLSDFLKIYVLDWHVLCAFLIPLLFATFFPIYWFFICPAVWKSDLSLYRPRSWLIGYWLLASLIWLAFLIICFLHMRNGRKLALAMKSDLGGNCVRAKSYSTEDLWNEDSYLPTPEYKINQIQPQVSHCWDLKRPNLKTPTHFQQHEEEVSPLLVAPPTGFTNEDLTTGEDSASFDTILASLQSLAQDIEKDFDNCHYPEDGSVSLANYPIKPAKQSGKKTTRSTGDLSRRESP